MADSIEVFLERETANDTDAIVVDILARSGAIVEHGQLLLVVETSKANQEIYSPIEGTITHSLRIGDVIEVGSRLAEIAPTRPGAVRPAVTQGLAAQPRAAVEYETARPTSRLSRAAAELALECALDLTELEFPFVTRKRLEQYLQSRSFGRSGNRSPEERVASHTSEQSGADERIAVQLPAHKHAEIRALQSGAGASMLSLVGGALGPEPFVRKDAGFFENKILDIVVHQASRLMRRYPKLNAAYRDSGIIYHSQVNAGVALDGLGRLAVYGIERSDALELSRIQTEIIRGFAGYADETLTTQEMTRATFTITDLSSFDLNFVLPLLPSGQTCIIGITRSVRDGYNLYVGFDHRVTEGLEVSGFLNDLRESIVREAR